MSGPEANRSRAAARAIGIAAIVILAACSRPPPDTATGTALLQPFKAEMKQALQAGLAQGPVEAIDVCRVRAPDIAAALSREGVRVGRSSHRLRNPNNVAPDWADEILRQYLADESTRGPVAVRLADARIGHAEPIVVQPLCLVCHGEVLAPDLADAIASAYPEDRATGFKEGDLRGIFWVEYPEER